MKAVLLLILAIPCYAQAPVTPPILISGEERQAIIDKFNAMGAQLERPDKALTNCRTAQRT